MKFIRSRMHVIACVALTISSVQAQETFPSTTIRWGVPYAAGGGSDAQARIVDGQMATLPSVPTRIDVGYTDTEAVAWKGLTVSASTPSAIVQKLGSETQKPSNRRVSMLAC